MLGIEGSDKQNAKEQKIDWVLVSEMNTYRHVS